MRLLHSSSTRSGLAGSLGGELIAGSFASSRLACGLFGMGHLGVIFLKVCEGHECACSSHWMEDE